MADVFTKAKRSAVMSQIMITTLQFNLAALPEIGKPETVSRFCASVTTAKWNWH